MTPGRSWLRGVCALSLIASVAGAQAAPKRPATAPKDKPAAPKSAPAQDPKAAPDVAPAAAAPPAEVGPAQAPPSPASAAPSPPAAAPGYAPGQPPPGWAPQYAPQPYWPPPGYVPVVITGDPSPLTVSLSYDKKSPAIVQCGGDCTVYVPPREYWITVEESPETVGGKRSIEVNGPTRLEVEPRTKSSRSTGLAMGIGGIGLLVVGTVAMMAGLVQSIDNSVDSDGGRRNNDDGTSLLLLGLAGFTAGAVLTPVGWVKFGRSAPGVNVQALQATPR